MVESSAKISAMDFERPSGISFMFIKNLVGFKTDPWGTPETTLPEI